MAWLIDTGILLRLINPADPEHVNIRRALRELKRSGETLVTTGQNLAEFWNVCTRPTSARGGYDLTVEATERKLRLLERLFSILPDVPSTYSEWRRLVILHAVKGVQVHDTRIVALMMVHGVANILTLNIADFTRFRPLAARTPVDVISPTAGGAGT